MNSRGLVIAEVVMVVGMGIAILGGLAILVASDGGPTVGFVSWGIGCAFLIFSSGRTAISILKREVRKSQSG